MIRAFLAVLCLVGLSSIASAERLYSSSVPLPSHMEHSSNVWGAPVVATTHLYVHHQVQTRTVTTHVYHRAKDVHGCKPGPNGKFICW